MIRIVLDECVPRTLARALRDEGWDASPFPAVWKQSPDGNLLDRTEAAGFSVLITYDRNMRFQQTLAGRRVAVLVVPALRRRESVRLAPVISQGLNGLQEGEFTVLTADGRFIRPTEQLERS